jgi:hypothetical protein
MSRLGQIPTHKCDADCERERQPVNMPQRWNVGKFILKNFYNVLMLFFYVLEQRKMNSRLVLRFLQLLESILPKENCPKASKIQDYVAIVPLYLFAHNRLQVKTLIHVQTKFTNRHFNCL